MIWGREEKLQIPPLRSPGFPVKLDGVGEHHAPFLKRKAHTRPCPALRSRKSGYAPVGMTKGRGALSLRAVADKKGAKAVFHPLEWAGGPAVSLFGFHARFCLDVIAKMSYSFTPDRGRVYPGNRVWSDTGR